MYSFLRELTSFPFLLNLNYLDLGSAGFSAPTVAESPETTSPLASYFATSGFNAEAGISLMLNSFPNYPNSYSALAPSGKY